MQNREEIDNTDIDNTKALIFDEILYEEFVLASFNLYWCYGTL